MVARPAAWRARATTLLAVLLGGYVGALAVDRSRIVVRGPSMAPTLLEGDIVLTAPALPRWLRPGQVVLLRDPADADHLVIKRVHAVEAGSVFVLGDDPDRSTDSRVWGWVATGAVRRLVLLRWPDVRSPLRWVCSAPPDARTGGQSGDQTAGRRARTSSSGSSSATSPSARRP